MKSFRPFGGKRFREWLSIQIVRNPSRVILAGIILINLFFILLSATIICLLSPGSGVHRGFFESLFYTITMIMDAGCIAFVVDNPSPANAMISLICLLIILVGMVSFTGGIIGYVSNQIASFIDNSNAGRRRLIISKHTIILNWNSRASEIINDKLYGEFPEIIVVLVSEKREEIMTEIDDRIADTISREREAVYKETAGMGFFKSFLHMRKNSFRPKVTVIVRHGDPFSNKQLMDISIDKARSVIILNRDRDSSIYSDENASSHGLKNRGNSTTVKTLALVAELTAAETSANDQKIIVEVEDPWTAEMVDKIISHKENLKKCNIVPVHIFKILGQLLSQFSIMPDLNLVYNELFSNKGAEFYSVPFDIGIGNRDNYLAYFASHSHAIPLTSMDTKSGRQFFFMADSSHDLILESSIPDYSLNVDINFNYWQPQRNILILGHNSNIVSLMNGFQAYRDEWNPSPDGGEILNICVIDDKKGLETVNYYRDYPYVSSVVEADLFNQNLIYKTINRFIDDQDGDTGILILSDDAVRREDFDATALSYLIYVEDILSERKLIHGGKDIERIDVIVEILNPKNYDVVHSYSVDNIVISNRYISKMLGQLGENDALFEFYDDILTYDTSDMDGYISRELYIKRAGDYFARIPGPCTAAELIRAIYIEVKENDCNNLALLLGYIKQNNDMVIFSGDQKDIPVSLHEDDRLILFSNH